MRVLSNPLVKGFTLYADGRGRALEIPSQGLTPVPNRPLAVNLLGRPRRPEDPRATFPIRMAQGHDAAVLVIRAPEARTLLGSVFAKVRIHGTPSAKVERGALYWSLSWMWLPIRRKVQRGHRAPAALARSSWESAA
jgi:hypothetical protein